VRGGLGPKGSVNKTPVVHPRVCGEVLCY